VHVDVRHAGLLAQNGDVRDHVDRGDVARDDAKAARLWSGWEKKGRVSEKTATKAKARDRAERVEREKNRAPPGGGRGGGARDFGETPGGCGTGDAPFGVLAERLDHFLHAALHLLVLGGCEFGSSGGRVR
jgi:hypothetical protein